MGGWKKVGQAKQTVVNNGSVPTSLTSPKLPKSTYDRGTTPNGLPADPRSRARAGGRNRVAMGVDGQALEGSGCVHGSFLSVDHPDLSRRSDKIIKGPSGPGQPLIGLLSRWSAPLWDNLLSRYFVPLVP